MQKIILGNPKVILFPRSSLLEGANRTSEIETHL